MPNNKTSKASKILGVPNKNIPRITFNPLVKAGVTKKRRGGQDNSIVRSKPIPIRRSLAPAAPAKWQVSVNNARKAINEWKKGYRGYPGWAFNALKSNELLKGPQIATRKNNNGNQWYKKISNENIPKEAQEILGINRSTSKNGI